MLINIDDRSPITYIPHQPEYQVWKHRLTEEEYEGLVAKLTERINSDSIHTSSWIPGSDWTGTPYQIIYEKACGEDERQAAFFFGLILWDAVMRHPDTWAMGKYNIDKGILGTTYFRVEL